MSKRREIRVYSEKLRVALVNAVEKEGLSVAEACRHYKVTERTGYRWRSHFGESAPRMSVVDVSSHGDSEKIKKLEGLVSELSIKCKVLREQVRIYERITGEESKKKLSTKQLEELESLKEEMEKMLN